MNYVVIVHGETRVRAYGVDSWAEAVGFLKRSVKGHHRAEVMDGADFLRDKDRIWPCMEEIETMVWEQSHPHSCCDYDAGMHRVLAQEEAIQDG